MKKEFKCDLFTTPKNFRVWDSKHNRWFQGGTDKRTRSVYCDNIDFFGEIMTMEGTLFDQNEDDAWKKDDDIKGSLDVLNYLTVVQNIGVRDSQDWFIFEGDIVELSGIEKQHFFVSYDKETCAYVLKDRKNHIYSITPSWNSVTIIGNIFENGELLCPSILVKLKALKKRKSTSASEKKA